MNYMTNKIVAIQGDIPSKLNPETDTSIFLLMKFKIKDIKFSITNQKIFQLLIQKW